MKFFQTHRVSLYRVVTLIAISTILIGMCGRYSLQTELTIGLRQTSSLIDDQRNALENRDLRTSLVQREEIDAYLLRDSKRAEYILHYDSTLRIVLLIVGGIWLLSVFNKYRYE